MPTPQQSDWEIDFIKTFYVYNLIKGTPAGAEKEAVAFIKSLLQKERESMVSKLERMKVAHDDKESIIGLQSDDEMWHSGWKTGITDAINQIQL